MNTNINFGSLKNLLTTILMIAVYATSLLAQQDIKAYYQNQIEEKDTLLDGGIHYLLLKTAEGAYVKKVFYPEKKALTHYMTYSDDGYETLHGPYKVWFDDGSPWMEGQYSNGQRSGTWTHYPITENDRLYKGQYTDGRRDGVWVWLDSLGNIIEERMYQSGILEGSSKIYDVKGQLVALRVYKNGVLQSESYFPTKKIIDTVEMIQLMPMIKSCDEQDVELRKKCSDKKLLNEIYSQITYPEYAVLNEIEGVAYYILTIAENGSVEKITTMHGLCEDIEAECLRVLRALPAWNPGRRDGKAIVSEFKLPIVFRLK